MSRTSSTLSVRACTTLADAEAAYAVIADLMSLEGNPSDGGADREVCDPQHIELTLHVKANACARACLVCIHGCLQVRRLQRLSSQRLAQRVVSCLNVDKVVENARAGHVPVLLESCRELLSLVWRLSLNRPAPSKQLRDAP
eukprot:jgi/Chrpa1/6456/Chrysochromulina_OHIO_Genome00014521-RA